MLAETHDHLALCDVSGTASTQGCVMSDRFMKTVETMTCESLTIVGREQVSR